MSKLSTYVNEFISFVVMLLLLAALISGQLNSQAMKIAAVDDDRVEISHIRLEDE
jgi:archaellum component FlaG (FlaF/FlaG flagellin family)